MKRLYILLIPLLLLGGCQRKAILIDETHTIEGRVWNRYTPQEFVVEIDNADDYYHIDLSAAVDTTLFRYNTFPFMIEIVGPAGESRSFHTSLMTRQNDHWMGDNGSIDRTREVSARIRKFFTFNTTGTYTVKIDQSTSQYDLEGACAVGLKITRAKLDLPDDD